MGGRGEMEPPHGHQMLIECPHYWAQQMFCTLKSDR